MVAGQDHHRDSRVRIENVNNVTHESISHLIVLEEIPCNQDGICGFRFCDFKNPIQGLHTSRSQDFGLLPKLCKSRSYLQIRCMNEPHKPPQSASRATLLKTA